MRKNHSIDLKIKAVLKASKPGITASEVADEIGIHTFSLYRLKKGIERRRTIKQNAQKERSGIRSQAGREAEAARERE